MSCGSSPESLAHIAEVRSGTSRASMPLFELKMPLLDPSHPPTTPRNPDICKTAKARSGAVTINKSTIT